jgi:pimeloyl-ACP methyl ester carboxylesterase
VNKLTDRSTFFLVASKTERKMEKVISKDGTPIGFYRRGAGPPLILVSGSGTANPIAWTAVIAELEKHYTVYALYRRGRGASGDNPNYAIQREFEDIAAVVDAMDEPANLLGHSYGALCALEAALLTHNLRKLVLYEPGIKLPGVILNPPEAIQRMQTLLELGDREGLLAILYREILKIPEHEYEQLRSAPSWSERVAFAQTMVREARAEETMRSTRSDSKICIPRLCC